MAAAGPPANPAAGMSPGRLWDMAFSDYAAGQWPLAIQGFETYMRAFPRSEQADDAQFYIGEAYQLDGKMREALAAYERVAADYPQSNRAADSYYKRGVIYNTLNQPDKAREMFETTINSSRTRNRAAWPASCWTAGARRVGTRRALARPPITNTGEVRREPRTDSEGTSSSGASCCGPPLAPPPW